MNDDRTLELVRLRLLARGTQSSAKLADSLLPYLEDEAPERWRERWAALLERLATEGELEAGELGLTPKGRERALASIGLSSLPARASFQSLLRTYLVPRALGIEDERAKKRVRSADGLRAALLAPASAKPPTLKEAVDQLVWRALDLPADGPLTLKKLRERALARELGRPMPLERAIPVIAAKAAGARRTEPQSLVEAVVRRWLAEGERTAAAHEHAPEAAEPDAGAIARFAGEVLAIARDPATRRFAEKAFVESVWSRARETRSDTGDLEHFKHQLLDAHKRGFLVLSRADLTQLLDPRDLAASEIRVDGAAFHFVRTDVPEAAR